MNRLMLSNTIGTFGAGLNSFLLNSGERMAALFGIFVWVRGAGKTRTGSELFIRAVRFGGCKSPNLVGATAEDVREIMVERESGILACAPEDFRPEFIPSLKKLIWPNKVETHIYYGSEPNKARGPQSDYLWCDELAKWQFPEETFDNLLMGLRLGSNPLCMVTTTVLHQLDQKII